MTEHEEPRYQSRLIAEDREMRDDIIEQINRDELAPETLAAIRVGRREEAKGRASIPLTVRQKRELQDALDILKRRQK
jgi:hypothetical protein